MSVFSKPPLPLPPTPATARTHLGQHFINVAKALNASAIKWSRLQMEISSGTGGTFHRMGEHVHHHPAQVIRRFDAWK